MSRNVHSRTLLVEFLHLDLTTCDRCIGTQKNLLEALELVRPGLDAINVELLLRNVHVQTEADARAHRLLTSPTIRINGSDIASELLESHCASCGDLCCSTSDVACRVWRWQGEEQTAAPVGMIVEALLRASMEVSNEAFVGRQEYHTPENLRRFFAGKVSTSKKETMVCCSPEVLETCCAPSAKSECCTTESAECGC